MNYRFKLFLRVRAIFISNPFSIYVIWNQSLSESVCPSQNVEGAGNVRLTAFNPDKGGKYAGCYSPCALLTYTNWGNPYAKYSPVQSPADQYCCAGAFNTNPTCM